MPKKAKAKGTARTPSRRVADPKVRKDPLKEYDEAMAKDGVEMVGLLDPGNLSNVSTWISTGSLALDMLLNNKGIPCGRLTELYGPQHIGKSTILDQIIASVQKMGGFGVLIDTESARDNVYVRALGVDESRLRMLQFTDPKKVTIETIFDNIIATVEWWRTEMPDTPIVIGLDSLGNCTTKSEMEKSVGERTVASAAKALRDAMRKLTQVLSHSKCALVIVNHQYTNIPNGPMRVSPRETYGGQAVRLAATYRLELFNKGMIKRQDGAVIGRQVGVRLDKNRFGSCRDIDVAVITGMGVSNTWSIYEGLKSAERIKTSGSWSTMKLESGEVKFQGWSGLEAKFAEEPSIFVQACDMFREVSLAAL